MAYPSVLEPLRLSGSRGVIRVDDPASFVAAWERTRRVVLREGGDPDRDHLLIEEFLPGIEVALEGLLSDGELRPLALFDKPDPLDGPFFEETIYVTPSRLPIPAQTAIAPAPRRRRGPSDYVTAPCTPSCGSTSAASG